jgi:hypothetical protein
VNSSRCVARTAPDTPVGVPPARPGSIFAGLDAAPDTANSCPPVTVHATIVGVLQA